MDAGTDTPPPRIDIARIVAPRSIAVVGASDDVGKFGGRVIHYLIKHGFAGTLVPINPRRPSVRGLTAYPKVSDCPEAIDVAIIAVPAAQLLEQVEDCAAAGVGACILITGKMAEVDDERAALQDRVAGIARDVGMRLVGPNCLGIFNMIDHTALSSSLALEVPALRPGGIGMVSQSGALMGTLVSRAMDDGAGFSRCISVGNQADLYLTDFFAFLVDDPATRAICLYVEGLRDPARFLATARRARDADKPVLAVKVGRSEAGVKSARSHTASFAGSYAAFAAACTAAGVVMMEDPTVMVMTADALLRLPRLRAEKLGVAAIASSGGSTAIFADQLEAAGLRGPDISAATRTAMERWILPAHVHVPVDTGAFTDGTSLAGVTDIIETFMAEPDIGAVVYPMTTSPSMGDYAALLPPLARAGGKPILFAMMAGDVGDDARRRLAAADFPYFDRVSDVLAVLRGLEAHARLRCERGQAEPVRPADLVAAKPVVHDGALTESEAKQLLASYGIPVAREAAAPTLEAALRAAERIGYPVVMKGVARGVVHKSDAGLVRLDLRNEAALRAAFEEIGLALSQAPGEHEGCVVQEMVRGDAELILGTRYDPAFGPLVLVGFGGILVELARDVQLAPAPVGEDAARAMLHRLAFWPILAGTRGRAALDIASVVAAIVRLSWLAADLGPRLVECDVNPLIVRGSGAIAADARATLAP